MFGLKLGLSKGLVCGFKFFLVLLLWRSVTRVFSVWLTPSWRKLNILLKSQAQNLFGPHDLIAVNSAKKLINLGKMFSLYVFLYVCSMCFQSFSLYYLHWIIDLPFNVSFSVTGGGGCVTFWCAQMEKIRVFFEIPQYKPSSFSCNYCSDPTCGGRNYILKWVFFVWTILADRYTHRREMWVVVLKRSSSAEMKTNKIFLNFAFFEELSRVEVLCEQRDIWHDFVHFQYNISDIFKIF